MPDIFQLIDQLSSADTAERSVAAEQLAQLGEDARPAAVSLVRATADDEEVAEWATAALEDMGPPSIDDAKQFAALLQDDNSNINYWSATLIGRLGPAAAHLTDLLVRSLESNQNAPVRQRCAWALSKIGPPARSAMASLKRASDGNDPRLASLAVKAIEKLGGE